MSVVTPTDRPKLVRNSCVIKLCKALMCCYFAFYDVAVGIGVFVKRLSFITSLLSFHMHFVYQG